MKLYNTLARQKLEFKPLNPPRVKMYVCGPTVYDFLHIGNFRGPVVCNLLRHWLEQEHGYEVTYALNFTDVDDRILNKAKEQGVDSAVISERYIEEYKKDFAALGLRPHELNPKVTDTMAEIIQMIEELIKNGKAYAVGGDVNYSVRSFEEYGKLSGRRPDDLQAGARVEVDEKKKDPLDFALWKAAKPGEQSWPSPWGQGRPGWHIECSAMVFKHLGKTIDIHGGGSDLMFPHHENEIAQSEGCSGKTFSNFWLHWNMINVGGEKMSKSLGNFTTLRRFLESHHPELYKWMILSVHYRTLADFSPEGMDRAVTGLARIYSALALAEDLLRQAGVEMPSGLKFQEARKKFASSKEISAFLQQVDESLNDDLNTPEAFAALFELIRWFNAKFRRGQKMSTEMIAFCQGFVQSVRSVGQLMSLFQLPPSEFLAEMDAILLKKLGHRKEDVQEIVDERSAARGAKDFAKSDELRAKLTGMGIAVSDTPEGSYWEVAK